ncbi:MAG: sulfatase-like hydrolase/transferase, partial [Elusimicrobia bacterium]|nr:sulfatase-like hydrolase/transferase [Elusimicrobiota bacterium]
FAAMLTRTNHGPFTTPDYLKNTDTNLPKELRTQKYSDYALGKFFKEAVKAPFFKNTVFIITSDHAPSYPDFDKKRFHIPLLLYSPLIKTPKKDARLISQLDLAPTIIALCNLPVKQTDTTFWGVPISQKKENGFAYILDDPYFGLITEKYFYRESISGDFYLFDRRMRPSDNKNMLKKMQDYCRAVLQMSESALSEVKAATLWKNKTPAMQSSKAR